MTVAPIPGKPARDLALEIYYAQRDFLDTRTSAWATNLTELGLKPPPYSPPGWMPSRN